MSLSYRVEVANTVEAKKLEREREARQAYDRERWRKRKKKATA